MKRREDVMREWGPLRDAGLTIAEAAARMGMSQMALDRAIVRARNAGDPRAAGVGGPRPLTGPDDPRHGTASAYTRYGCRCDECRAANTARCNARRAARTAAQLPEGDARHGLRQSYTNWGCRCERCSADHAQYLKEKYLSRVSRGLAQGDPRHGTVTGYSAWGCRCDQCRVAHREYVQRRRAA